MEHFLQGGSGGLRSVRAVNALDALVGLCSPPTQPPSQVDWTQVEAALGTALPTDYKHIVQTYGSGLFDDTIWLLAPTPPTLTMTWVH